MDKTMTREELKEIMERGMARGLKRKDHEHELYYYLRGMRRALMNLGVETDANLLADIADDICDEIAESCEE